MRPVSPYILYVRVIIHICMRKLYAVILTLAMISAAMMAVTISTESSDAASSATIECYIDDSTGNNFSFADEVNVKAYYRTGPVGSTSISDYSVISSSAVKTAATNIYKVELTGINTEPAVDASKVFICFDIQNYTVNTLQTKFFDLSKTVKLNDTANKRVFTLYGLSSEFTTIEGNNTYTIGSDSSISAGAKFEFAKGTITGKITNTDGENIAGAEVSVTDILREKTAIAVTNSNGEYTLTFLAGKYDVNINASMYNVSKIDNVHFYDDTSYDPEMNKQKTVNLSKLPTTSSSTVIGYISNTNGTNFDKVSSIQIAIYYEKGADYELLSETAVIQTVKEETGTYYKFTLTEIPYKSVAKCYLYINMTGYSIGMLQTECFNPIPHMLTKTLNVAYKFNTEMFPTGYFEPEKTYKIGSEMMPGIQMKDAKGTITGKVTTNTSTPAALNGVTVNIYDSKKDTLVASGITSDNGNYSIVCSTGYYKITASINDYQTYTGYVTVYDDQYNPELNIQPDIKLSSSQTLFGTDLPHVLMAIGLIVAAILILIVTIHRLKFFKKGLDIYDDEKEEK